MKPKHILTAENKVETTTKKIEKIEKDYNKFLNKMEKGKLLNSADIVNIQKILEKSNSYFEYKKLLTENVDLFKENLPDSLLNTLSEDDKIEIKFIFEDVLYGYHCYDKLKKSKALLEKLEKYIEEQTEIWNSIPEIVYEFVDKWIELARKWYLHNEPEIKEYKLKEILENSREQKLYRFSNQVYSVVGKILDVKQLSIGETGLINGVVIGENGKASITTFGAGGYSVQCFHFRTTIKKLKEK